MNENQRTPIQTIKCDPNATGMSEGKVIRLRKEGSATPSCEFFKINDNHVGEGGSCVCYDATLIGEKKRGRLKEFYPLYCSAGNGSFALNRSADNHVICTDESKKAFLEARDEFIHAYHMLRDVMEEHADNADFTSFIPDFSIYYACDTEGNFIDNTTAYIWTAPENLTVFEDYIRDIRQNPTEKPEHKLFTVLKTILTLTECINILHEKDLLHLDIKPSNFGIPQRKGDLLTDSITLFDINTIYSPDSSAAAEFGTDGYRAPELLRGNAYPASDIYAIGCTLFSAIVIHKNVTTQGYQKEYYPDLQELIDESALIKASETNDNIFLKDKLNTILKKCLAHVASRRYKSCTDLANDLRNALAYLYPAQINENLPFNQKLVILEKELDKKRGSDTRLNILYHLYQKTLFNCADQNSPTLDVLLIGFGNYGQKFLDCCLQLAQVYGKKLNVKIVSNNRSGAVDKDLYLAKRPALLDFFTVDHMKCKDPYGTITFVTKEFASGSEMLKQNRALARQIAGETDKERYIFIALGDDELNRNIAQAFSEATEGKHSCSVNFAVEGDHLSGTIYGNPVYMSDDITQEEAFLDIERMAFNAHLLWENGLNIDMKQSWEKFKDPYNYHSSISNAISIRYKLQSFGISTDDLIEAAAKYEKMITTNTDKRNEMIAAEHRRWVCEKICDGWTRLENLENCVDGNTQNKQTKQHICLVRSRADAPLSTEKWTERKWDTATAEDLADLDELDRLSVELHQTYLKHAEHTCKTMMLFDDAVKQLKSICNRNPSSGIAFSEWNSCLSLLWSRIGRSAKEYGQLKDQLTETLKNLEKENLEKANLDTALALIDIIDKRFAILRKSMAYTDWKDADSRLVNGIPFILTYKKDTHLSIPLSVGNNTDIFGNVAAATALNPSQITYCYHFDDHQALKPFLTATKYILNYLPEKHVFARLHFILSYKKGSKLKNEIETAVEEIRKCDAENMQKHKKDPLIQTVVIIKTTDDYSIARDIAKELDETFHPDAIEQNFTPLSYLFLGSGIYQKRPKYRFDAKERQFYDIDGCEFLRYVKTGQYLKITDMFASKNSKSTLESPLAFYNDYEMIWKKAYRGHETVWKKMCDLLANHHKSDILTKIDSKQILQKGPLKKYRYLVPANAFESVQKLITFMQEVHVFGDSSEIHYYTPDSCIVNIIAAEHLEEAIQRIFADPQLLTQTENLKFEKTSQAISVIFDRLHVSELILQENDPYSQGIKELLKQLERDFSFICGYTESSDGQSIRFSYATKRVKKLLTNTSHVLEMYIYLRCLKSGLFDDVATSYEIAWEGTPITSEFDVIVTNGFSGLLIETQATDEIKPDFYFKLSSLANSFGMNSIPVLVADTETNGLSDPLFPSQQGNMLDVITITSPDDINKIEKTLAKLLHIPV